MEKHVNRGGDTATPCSKPNDKLTLARHQPWTIPGYVCRQCRHQLAATQLHQGAQARHQSTSLTVPVDAGADDWMNNLNSLSETPAQSRRRKERWTRSRKQLAQEGRHPAKDHAVAPARHVENARRRLSSKALIEASAAGVVDSKPGTAFRRDDLAVRREDSGRHQRKKRREEFERSKMRQQLVAATSSQSASHNSNLIRYKTSNSTFQPQAYKDLEDIRASLAAVDARSRSRLATSQTLSEDKTNVADDVEVLSGRVSGQRSNTQLTSVSEPLESTTAPQDSYSATALGSRILARSSPTGDEDSDHTPPEDTKLPPRTMESLQHNPITTQPYRFTSSQKPLSPAQKLVEAKNRPTWGGVSPSPALNASSTSFESLRAADKISAKPVTVTAGETKPWGLDAVVKPSNKSDSTQEGGMTPEQPRASVGGLARFVSGFTSAGLDLLKQTLRGTNRADRGVRKSVALRPDTQHQVEGVESVITPTSESHPGGRSRGDVQTPYPPNTAAQSNAITDDVAATVVPVEDQATDSTAIAISSDDVAQRDDAMERLAKLHQNGSVRLSPVSTSTASPPAEKTPSSTSIRLSNGDGGGVKPKTKRGRTGKRGHVKPSKELQDAEGVKSSSDRTIETETYHSLSDVMSSTAAAQLSERAGPSVSGDPELSEPEEEQVSDIQTISPSELRVIALNIPQPTIPPLQYGLDRVLFNPGVYQLQDPHSRVYNFDPYLQKIMPVSDFDFNALKQYKTSSEDTTLSALASEHGTKYAGSTSSMTGTLAHFHYLLSNWRELNLNMMSRAFPEEKRGVTFTNINKAPNAIFLRWQGGTYAIDADKEYDSPNVLMMLGKSMEKLLTLPTEEFERYRKGSDNGISSTERAEPEAYEFTVLGDFLMRSQLDAYDPRLPGTGWFDLKTRAVAPIRMDAEGYQDMLGYEIHTLQGRYESYEREYYDMMRSTMLKYMLQARMGRMDGIFVAYHNTERIFGFQYISIAEMDRALHGQVDRCLGDQEFKTSVSLLNEVCDMATKQFPEQSLRIHFEATEAPMPMMWVFAEPMTEKEIEAIQATSHAKVAEYERSVMQIEKSDAEPAADSTTSDKAAPAYLEDYMSTTTPADPGFYKHISAAQAESAHKPLFAATILCQNSVNGSAAEDNRPRNLKRDDKWEVQYILKEAVLNPADKWARYEDLKTRRRKQYQKHEAEEGEVESTRQSEFLRMLREMSMKGREFRAEIDKLEEGSEKIVVGAPLDTGEHNGRAGQETAEQTLDTIGPQEGDVQDVDGYMRWLYGGQGSAR